MVSIASNYPAGSILRVRDAKRVFAAREFEGAPPLGGVAPTRLRDCVLNRTHIDRTTKQMISDRAPSAYLAEIRDTPGFPSRRCWPRTACLRARTRRC